MFVKYKQKAYAIQNLGEAVFELNENGTYMQVSDGKEIAKILTGRNIISETEALIIAYAQKHHSAEQQAIPAQVRVALKKGAVQEPSRKAITRTIVFTLAAVCVVCMGVFIIPGGLSFLLGLFMVVVALPPIVFGITLACISVVALITFLKWAIDKWRVW